MPMQKSDINWGSNSRSGKKRKKKRVEALRVLKEYYMLYWCQVELNGKRFIPNVQYRIKVFVDANSIKQMKGLKRGKGGLKRVKSMIESHNI